MNKFILVALMLGMTGCAAVKTCERFSVMMGSDRGGNTIYALDQENVEKLADTLKGLSEGTCKLK